MEYAQDVIRILGGSHTFSKKLSSDCDFIGVVRRGLPWQAVESAARSLEMSEEQTFTLLKISKRTAARRRATKERLRETESERLLRLARVIAMANDVLGGQENAVRWLKKPNRALGGEIPVELLDTDIGFQSVMDVLRRINYGVYS